MQLALALRARGVIRFSTTKRRVTPSANPPYGLQAGGLRQQRRFADAGIAANQQHRASDKTAAGDAIELGHPGGRRGASWLLPVNVSSANNRPLRLEQIETGIAVVPVSSSASVFHSPQDSHLPCQRLYAAPQFWQTKESAFLAMAV
jgi:hypothetical protein